MIGEVIDYLKSQKNMAIILGEQYFDFAFARTDYIFAITGGEIVYEGRKGIIDKKIKERCQHINVKRTKKISKSKW